MTLQLKPMTKLSLQWSRASKDVLKTMVASHSISGTTEPLMEIMTTVGSRQVTLIIKAMVRRELTAMLRPVLILSNLRAMKKARVNVI